MSTESPYRLPKTVIPRRYELVVEPDLAARSFSGSIAAEVEVTAPVREIVMNAAELELSAPRVLRADGSEVAVAGLRLDAETERVHVELGEDLAPGTATVSLSFAAPLNERLIGFYASTYRDEAGTEHVIGTTHFESTDARRAFPCWDEPELKAVWSIALVVDEGVFAVSNAREIGRETVGGKVRVRFADTMSMSSYLVAYVVGRLEATPARDVDGVPLRIVHVPGKGDLTSFALDAGASALRFFSDYYGIRYPGDKLDMIALPDFAMGAMENLGCITYREALLLVDPARAAQREVQIVAEVIAHEIAHMWFGDLVTMRWWNGIWLNEAFASLMETLSVDAWKPEWDLWTQFGAYRSAAFAVDALESTRPIEYPVESPDDSQDMFDILTYTKGQAVLRMLERYLGDGFREGIRRYLARHAYGNTETEDLWAALEEASGEPVRRIMDPWILGGGFPVVDAAATADGVRLSHTRFRLGGGDTVSPWEIPLFVRHRGGTERLLVPASGTALAVPDAGPVVVNAEGHAFARVRYDEDLLGRLTGTLRDLSATERFQLVDDTWANVLAGSTSASTFVRFAAAFDGEDDLTVWQALIKGFSWLDRCVDGAPRQHLAATLRRLARPAFDRLGLEPRAGEAPTDRTLRGTLFRTLGTVAADPDIPAIARDLEERARGGAPIDADVASAAIDVVAATGDVADFERFLAAREAAATPQEELRYIYALADFSDPVAFRRMLAVVDSEAIRVQEQPFVMRDAMANRDHGAEAWDYVRDRWDAIAGRVSPANLERLAQGVMYLITPELQRETSAFFAAHDIPQAHNQLLQSLELQRINVGLRQRAAIDLATSTG